MTDPTPQRVVVSDMGHGARKVILACGCVKVGGIITSWDCSRRPSRSSRPTIAARL